MMFVDEPEDKKQFDEVFRDVNEIYQDSARQQSVAMQPLRAIQLESGRDYARRRYFHKAITWYNDLLFQLYPDEEMSSRILIFSQVPTTETAGRFVDNLRSLVEGQKLLMNVQVELAGVLNASGLKPSAHFVWQRTIDDYDFFLKPSIAIAKDLMESYGLRMSSRADETIQTLDATVGLCREMITKHDLKVDWRKGEHADAKALAGKRNHRGVAAVVREFDREAAGLLSDADRERFDLECDAINSDPSLTFAEWLQWKKTLLEFRPTLAFRTQFYSPPWLACPTPYDAEEGFADPSDAARDVAAKTAVEAVLAWCKLPANAANADALAADASFLLGWYWIDMNQLPLARAALLNLARVKSDAAKQRPQTTEGLVDELHSYAAITAAGAIVDSLPGLSAYKTDYSALLEGQLRDWEKRWFAKSGYGPHATEQRLELLSRALLVKSYLARTSREWRSNRYFFPDYAFIFGAVPDYLAEKAFRTPELFRPLTEEEVKARGADAVEGLKWALITEEQADSFLNQRTVDGAIDEKIVRLGD
jgi:hypothetical protein